MKLTTAPPGGEMPILQAAVQVHKHTLVYLDQQCHQVVKSCCCSCLWLHGFLNIIFLPLSLQKAASGAESTRDLTARAGRASYIAAERVTLPDPGAVAVAAIFSAVLASLEGQK